MKRKNLRQKHYAEWAKRISKQAPNLVLIIADEYGKINFNGMNITPYTFAETFLQGSFGYPTEVDDPNFIVDEGISKKILEEGFGEMFDPLKQIESRKNGILLGSPISHWALKYHNNIKSKNGGYIFYVGDQHLKTFSKSKIDYLVISK